MKKLTQLLLDYSQSQKKEDLDKLPLDIQEKIFVILASPASKAGNPRTIGLNDIWNILAKTSVSRSDKQLYLDEMSKKLFPLLAQWGFTAVIDMRVRLVLEE